MCLTLILLGLATKERLLALMFVPVAGAYLVLLRLLPFEKPPGLRWRSVAIFAVPGLILGLFFVGPYVRDLSGWMAGFGYVNNNPIWLLAGVVFYVGLPTICFGTAGAWYFLARKDRAALLLSLGALIPLLAIMGLSLFHYTANRYVFMSLASWIVLAALAAVELVARTGGRERVFVGAAVLLLVLGPLQDDMLYHRFQNGNRDDWKSAFEVVRAQRAPGDLVVTHNPEIGDYYLRDTTVGLSRFDLTTLGNEGRRVWFVEDIVAQEIFPDVHTWLEKNARLVADFDVHVQARTFTMRVYLYDPVESVTKHLD